MLEAIKRCYVTAGKQLNPRHAPPSSLNKVTMGQSTLLLRLVLSSSHKLGQNLHFTVAIA